MAAVRLLEQEVELLCIGNTISYGSHKRHGLLVYRRKRVASQAMLAWEMWQSVWCRMDGIRVVPAWHRRGAVCQINRGDDHP